MRNVPKPKWALFCSRGVPNPASERQHQREARAAALASERRRLKAKGASEADIEMNLMEMDLTMTSQLSVFLDKVDADRLAAFTKKKPPSERVIWVMMDSGAANHVCDPVKHFGVFKLHTDNPGRKFVTATGEVVENKGEKRVRVQTTEGSVCNITFQCADVDMAVLSTRKLCQSGHEVLYQENGGLIIDTKSGQTTRFVQRGGVYYVKLRVLRPSEAERAADFARQA